MLKFIQQHFLACGAVVAMTFCHGALQSATINQSANFSSSDFSFSYSGGTSTNLSPIFGFDAALFDPSLGTLTGVSVSYGFTVTAQVSLGSSSGGASLSGGGSFFLGTNSFFGIGSGAANGSGPFSTIPLTYSVSGTITPGSSGLTLELVQGSGTSFLSWQPGLSLSIPSDASATGELSSGTLSINYDYTPAAVPEPTTIPLAIAASLLGFRFCNRRQS